MEILTLLFLLQLLGELFLILIVALLILLGFYSPNDTTGDEYYKYQWFRHSDSITTPSVSMLIGDSTSILDSVDSRFYNVVVEDNNNCTGYFGVEIYNSQIN